MLSQFMKGATVAALLLINASPGYSQGYPNKLIRIVTAPVGSSADFLARMIAQGIAGPLGQTVIVDNRASFVAAETVAKSPADGYTIYFTGGTFWIGSLLEHVQYDPVKDFAPITITHQQPNVLVVHPQLPAKSVKELIALAKAKPGQLNFVGLGVGGSVQLAGEVFKAMSGVNMTLVNYKLTATALSDVMTGQVQVFFAVASTVAEQIKSGRLRALAITSATPSALFPGMPTIAASGVPGYNVVGIYGVFAPARTPAAVISRLNQEINQSLNKPELKEKYVAAGLEVVGSTPEQLAAEVKSEMTMVSKVLKDAGNRAN